MPRSSWYVGLIGFLLAIPANAQGLQRSQFEIELSFDGVNWSNHLDAFAAAGTRVFGRVVVSYVQNDGPVAMWFNGVRFQPTVSNWEPTDGDTVVPFNRTARVVADYSANPPVLGRTLGATTVNPVVPHQYSFAGETYLRFAEGDVLLHPGEGSGSNNVNGSRGINTANSFLTPQLGLTELVLFTWGMDFHTNRITDDATHLRFTIPMEAYRLTSATSTPSDTRSATWLTSTSPFAFVEAPVLPTIDAVLTLNIPAPSAMVVGIGAGMFGLRRRRQ